MASCEIQSSSENSIELVGVLDASTVPHVWNSMESRLHNFGSDTITLDLAKLESVDTAGLACLVNCSVSCSQNNKTLQLQNVPENIKKLAKISDVDSILALQ